MALLFGHHSHYSEREIWKHEGERTTHEVETREFGGWGFFSPKEFAKRTRLHPNIIHQDRARISLWGCLESVIGNIAFYFFLNIASILEGLKMAYQYLPYLVDRL